MSVRIIDAVFRHSTSRGSARLVLLALADVASDTGEVTAYKRSQSVLAAKANIDPKTVPKAIDALLELGEVVLLDADGTEHTTRAASGHGRRLTNYRVKVGPDPASEGVPGSRGQTPPDTGSESPKPRGQTPPDRGSITPSLSVPDPSPSVARGATKKHLLPDDFTVTAAMKEWAAENAPGVNVDEQLAQFRDHWVSKAERRADWVATWRTWMRNAKRFTAGRPGPRPRPAPPLAPRLDLNSPQAGRVQL